MSFHVKMNSEPQNDNDAIPIKENGPLSLRKGSSSTQSTKNNPQIIRDELEDRYLQVTEENLNLKKQVRNNEEKIKQLATKLVRVFDEKSSHEKRNDLILEDQKERIAELEGQIGMLRDQLITTTIRTPGTANSISTSPAAAMMRIPSSPSTRPKSSSSMLHNKRGSFTNNNNTSTNKFVPASSSTTSAYATNNGIIKPPTKPSSKVNPKILSANSSKASLHSRPSDKAIIVNDQVTQLLFEAKGENHALRDQVKRLREELIQTERELMNCKDQLQIKEIEREDEIVALRVQLEQDLDLKKQKLADNIQLIKLQREVRRSTAMLSTYESQYQSLETNYNSANETIGQLELQVSNIQEELRTEQTKNIHLTKQADQAASVLHQMKEIQAQMNSLQEENKLVKEANENLLSKAFENGNRIKEAQFEDVSLKQQVITLEQSIRTELQAKCELLSLLNQEKSKCSNMEIEINQLNLQCQNLTSQLKEAELKLLNFDNNNSKQQIDLLDNNDNECIKCKQLEDEIQKYESKVGHIQNELIKSKQLLKTQIDINKEYQNEIEILSTKLEKADIFLHEKLNDFMRLVEQRTEQMSVLEKNLESISLKSIQEIHSSSVHNIPNTNTAASTKSSQLIPITETTEFAAISSSYQSNQQDDEES